MQVAITLEPMAASASGNALTDPATLRALSRLHWLWPTLPQPRPSALSPSAVMAFAALASRAERVLPMTSPQQAISAPRTALSSLASVTRPQTLALATQLNNAAAMDFALRPH